MRKRAEFLAIQGSGKRLPTRSFLLVHRPAEAPVARLGITVTKKIGNAVVRNRIKRAVREAFRQTRTELPRLDLVVIARQGAEALRPNEVAAELAPAFERLARGGAR